MEKFGKLFSTTSNPKGDSFIVWDRYPNALSKRNDRFALYSADGGFVGQFKSAVEAEMEASFLLSA